MPQPNIASVNAARTTHRPKNGGSPGVAFVVVQPEEPMATACREQAAGRFDRNRTMHRDDGLDHFVAAGCVHRRAVPYVLSVAGPATSQQVSTEIRVCSSAAS